MMRDGLQLDELIGAAGEEALARERRGGGGAPWAEAVSGRGGVREMDGRAPLKSGANRLLPSLLRYPRQKVTRRYIEAHTAKVKSEVRCPKPGPK